MKAYAFSGWPALESTAAALPENLAYERGVWGKVHGADSDFRWLARRPDLVLDHSNLEQELYLGSEDAPCRTQLWRSIGQVHYAVSCYPSRAVDAAGRSGLLEKQIVEWRRPPTVPATLGALLLLPRVAGFTDDIWWENRRRADWKKATFALMLDPSTCPPLSLGDPAVLIEQSMQSLLTQVDEAMLVEFYAALLAGRRAVSLPRLSQPLPPQAVAALLLPLPRARADLIALVNWVPSQRVEIDRLSRTWDIVLGGVAAGLVPAAPTPTTVQYQQAERMARALLQGDPGLLAETAPAMTRDQLPAVPGVIALAMWGPAAAGKTVLLAQLSQTTRDKSSDWDVFPTAQGEDFIHEMDRITRNENRFPPPTTPGQRDQIVCTFRNRRTGIEASLEVEDRAGGLFENFKQWAPDIQQRLCSAAGLVLMVDALGGKDKLYMLRGMLRRMHVAMERGARQDERPIAVCISKADILIDTPADWRRARDGPDEFVRERDQWGLVELLDQFCANYRLFPVSSVGITLRYGVIETVAFYDETLKPRLRPNGAPLNLLAPFAWLIEQVADKR